MIDWLTDILALVTWRGALKWSLIFVASFVANLAIVSFVLVKLPPEYFRLSHSREIGADRHPLVRWSALILKNLLGVVLIVLGAVLSLPGVPGQGLLTILLGLIMLDIPGKRPLEARLIRRPSVLQTINRLRAKFDKPPLILDEA